MKHLLYLFSFLDYKLQLQTKKDINDGSYKKRFSRCKNIKDKIQK